MSKKLRGTRAVYGFTLKQMMKNRANQVMFVIFILIALLAIPVSSLFFGGGGESTDTMAGFYSEMWTVEDYLSMKAEEAEMATEVGADTKFAVQYVYSIIVMIVSLFSISYIIQGIVVEKSSRLIETLLISIEPMALVLGKILAVMAYIFSLLLATVAAGALSWKISSLFLDVTFVSEGLVSMGITKDAFRLEPTVWIVMVVSMVLAYIFFSFIAGLSGAGCSNMEEMENANMSSMAIILVGYMVSCTAAAFEGELIKSILAIVPAVSPFTAPVFYLFGDIGLGVVAVSWAVELLCILVLWWMTAGVYHRLVLYKGNRVKWKQIIAMALKKEGGM